jgi:hypothetical protein
MKIDWIIGWIQEDGTNNAHRIRENNELLFCLRSIYKYCSWINKIHIILGRDCNPPTWLKEHNKINLVKESSLYQPVQKNSETKKLFYGRIKNIAEYFISSDDDMFLLNKLYVNELIYNNKPIINSTGFYSNFKDDDSGHIPIIWKRDDYNKIIDRYININYYLNLNDKRVNPFPEIKQHLINHRLAYKGFIKKPHAWVRTGETINKFIYQLATINVNKHRMKYICINDEFSSDNTIYHTEYNILHSFFNMHFNYNAPWEKKFITAQHLIGKSNTNTKDIIINLNNDILDNSTIIIKKYKSVYDDNFKFNIKNKNKNSFTISIKRLDRNIGWGQNLLINYRIVNNSI